MPAYVDHDLLAADVLQLVEDIQEKDPSRSFAHLTVRCQRDPAQMAQVLMCLAIWMDPETPVSVLTQRAEAIAVGRLGKSVPA
jgi:hypothetical protein